MVYKENKHMRDFALVTITAWVLIVTAAIASDVSAIREQNAWIICTIENQSTGTYTWCGVADEEV